MPPHQVDHPTSTHRRSRNEGLVRLAGILLAFLMMGLTGCTLGEDASGNRTGSRKLGESDTGFVTGKALTQIAPDQRQPAPVAAGPSLTSAGTVSTGNYPGKVVVLNVWGSWCAPCRAEATDLAEISRETDDVAAFVGLNIRDTSPDAARAYVRAFKVPYPQIYDPDGKQLVRFAGTLPPNGIPSTLIIDRQGRIAARVVGIVDKSTLLGLIEDTAQGR